MTAGRAQRGSRGSRGSWDAPYRLVRRRHTRPDLHTGRCEPVDPVVCWVPRAAGTTRPMPPPPEYKPTFFDRHGPDAGTYVRAIGAGVIAFLMTFGVTSARGNPWRAFFISLGAGLLTGGSGIIVGSLAAGLTSRFVFGGGTTPYVPQYSYQDALIQQGKLDEALASFEALI